MDGERRWPVFHDAQQDTWHLETAGVPPEPFAQIKDRLFSEREGSEGTDFVFDVPVELFVALGGIRYDRDIPGAGPEPWEVLSSPSRGLR